MKVGDLDSRISFQRNAGVPDGAGGRTKSWVNLSKDPEDWAFVRPIRGREMDDAGGRSAAGIYLFTIRNRVDISEDMRIMWDGVPYNIREVRRKNSRYRFIDVLAERGVAS